jgi:SAM-dependent methyltransferase
MIKLMEPTPSVVSAGWRGMKKILGRCEAATRELPYLAEAFAGKRRLLDIGCGLGLTSVLLALEMDLDELYLMDGQDGPRVNGFHSSATSPWINLDYAVALARENGVRSFHPVRPDPTAVYDVDAVMSLFSWGHHYPAAVYLPLARRSLPIGGRIVLDLRRNKRGAPRGYDEFEAAGFKFVGSLLEEEKMFRYCFERVR